MKNIKTFENFNNQDIFVYIKNNDVKSVKNYIDSGYDLNIQNDNGHTPLNRAVEYNNIEIVKLLLNASVDIDKQDYILGKTALIGAVSNNNIEIVKLLLNAGSDVNIQSNSSITALYAAVERNYIEIVKLLLNAGANINAQLYDGYTVLILASSCGYIEIVKLLLDSGADIDKQSYEDNRGFYPYKVTNGGNTALIQAASNNRREMIELLLDYGADEFVINYDGKSFYYLLNDENKEYFTQNYPTSVYNAISHNYKKSFAEFVKDYNVK